MKLARLRWGLNCVIISGSIRARLNCNGHVIMEIDIVGADMRSYIKADYGRHDLLSLAFFVGIKRKINGYKNIKQKNIRQKNK